MNKTTLNSQKEKHSMLSLRRATFRRQRARRGPQHFYPRSPCGERRCQTLSDCRYTAISIHALLAESDASNQQERQGQHISIHALLAESDFRLFFIIFNLFRFLSTLSLRRATTLSTRIIGFSGFLSTLSLRRATATATSTRPPCLFLSTLSLRRATPRGGNCYLDNIISIHALLAESDYYPMGRNEEPFNFYPRSPCGERLDRWLAGLKGTLFLSTLSLRRATFAAGRYLLTVLYFYPRSPCGERLML